MRTSVRAFTSRKKADHHDRKVYSHRHDEANECKEGDLVEIEATRKLSKTKAWRVSRLIERAGAA